MEKESQNKITKKLGATLKYTRMQQSISIAKISKELNLNPSTVVSIEDGKHQASFINIYTMLIYLNIDLKDFFESIQQEIS